ncbi:MAG TPA: YceD family protein [Casimicrobiaceae bacterium]|nr:YceD family protein [Casimicrobiaceae bacterium]
MQSTTQSTAGRRLMPFDALKLSASGESLTGEVDAADLPRVADRLATDAGAAKLAWRLVGCRDGQGRPALTLTVAGSVPLVCQRCLQPFAAIVDQSTELLLARSEAELARLDAEEIEVVLATQRLDALTLVEDELLLSLPFSPRHPDGECAASPMVAAHESSQNRSSPFGQLGELKKTSR